MFSWDHKLRKREESPAPERQSDSYPEVPHKRANASLELGAGVSVWPVRQNSPRVHRTSALAQNAW